jgi:hypothetical protein
MIACGTFQPAATPQPTATSTPIPTATNTLTPTPIPTTGAIRGTLIEEGTKKPVTDFPVMPYGPWDKDVGLWQILIDYKEVYPDQQGVFTLNDLSPGIYKIYAIIGENTFMGNKSPIMSFLKDLAGNEIEVEVVVGQIADIGQILVTK